MVEQTYIKGKDACLEDSIFKMQGLLEKAGFDIEQASWLNPVPNVYSVHIRDRFCNALFTNGKGASRKACLASALGEFFERLETNYFFSDYYLEMSLLGESVSTDDMLYFPDEKIYPVEDFKKCLSPELWSVYDPDDELEASDFLSLNDRLEGIRCLPMTQVSSEETIYFPMNLFSNLYASNGLSAGNNALEAQVQGLSEVFERWVKKRILTENFCLPEVPEAIIEQFPQVVQARKALEAQGIRVSIRDASLGGHFPVMNVTLFEQKSGQCFASFGAHPIFEVALERTLTESLQGRSLELLDGFQTPVFDQALVADDENIENHFIDSSGLIHARFISHDYDFDFVEWDFTGDTAAQFDYLVRKVHEQGTDVYVANYEHFGVNACRVVVPGMSEVFPFSELIDNNQNQGRHLREILETLSTDLTVERFEWALEEIDQLGLADHQGVANLIGLLPDGDSYWKKLKVVELEMWCLLAIQDYDAAYERLQDCFYFIDDDSMRLLYKAMSFALEAILNETSECHAKTVQAMLFGEETVNLAWSCIEGEQFFGGMDIGMDAFRNSSNHMNLLKVYQKVQAYKQLAN
ncbi:MAG: 30S ribosomal protein S12 methylthiotransferase accessory factor YcaO [Hydrogenovibrio sp.]|nr:30S ribosomal protein S12 methylthiotransferase accessory factor YcaO [Hydrogenovibrio sp.]